MQYTVEELNNNRLLHAMEISVASSSYFLWQILSLFVILTLLYLVLRRSMAVFGFPSFWIVVGWLVIYLIPSIAFGGIVTEGLLGAEYFYLGVINLTPLALLVWLYFSGVIFPVNIASPKEKYTSSSNQWLPIALLFGMASILLMYWLLMIPWSCTAGWAFLNDPSKTLLAREVAGKLSGEPNVARMIGVYINVLVPLLIFMCGVKIFHLIRAFKFRYLPIIVIIFLLVVFFYLTLFITGAKSSVLPVLIVCSIAVLLMPIGFFKKFGLIFGFIALCMGLIFFFQNKIGLSSITATKYSLGQCVKYFGTCEEAAKLVETASQRDGTIIGGRDGVIWAKNEIQNYCAINIDRDKNIGGVLNAENMGGAKSKDDAEVIPNKGSVLDGLINRSFKIPLQVAGWYYLWGSEFGQPGWKSVPIASRYTGEANIAIAVYKRYGVIYSGGDATSTSTAPSSFLLTWPAFMGWWGWIAAISSMIFLDFIANGIRKKISGPLLYGFAGLMVVLAYHLINTDLITALGSHGGMAAFALCSLLSLKFFKSKIPLMDSKGKVFGKNDIAEIKLEKTTDG